MGKSNRRTGSAAELAVSAKLVSLGYEVSFPFGGEAPYDIVACKDGRLVRIQVKSATISKYGSYRCTLTHGRASKAKYTSEECDVVVLFVPYSQDYTDISEDGFYVIPIKELVKINRFHAILFPSGRGRGNIKICKWEEFRDGWENI